MARVFPKARKPDWPFVLNRASPLARGLMFWAPGGPAGGVQLFDHSGKSRHLTITGATWKSGHEGGRALLFDDAASQYAELAAAIVTATPFTLACWFNTDDAAINED